ncbi:hypothetical protein CVT24_009727 [Panaeolus cyanescens]|uniref:Zn(2)-C6 fungal-type domain-containing protein n=1 Tax=Panaeolus cyanescens TaxID=181874 RepID=A0A409Y9V2_9AGAR|nr:hypothetical protein CVT24_009727 [Panaeolus cyanescens]
MANIATAHNDPMDRTQDEEDEERIIIRIPTSKAYLTQNIQESNWTGHRGKPRCDHCRANNLRCDRVLPMCNHCAWAKQDKCVYTPLPTPAHRGIPRCDRCRSLNMKCDRNLPICGNCKVADGRPCNYTAKRRNKGTTEADSIPGPMPQPSSSWPHPMPHITPKMEHEPQTLSFLTHSAPSTNIVHSPSPEPERVAAHGTSHTGRFTADYARVKPPILEPLPIPVDARIVHSPSPEIVEYIPPPNQYYPPVLPEPKILINAAHVEPWSHPTFVSLPHVVWEGLRAIDPVEMPNRQEFESALDAFQAHMIPDIRETTIFTMEQYSTLAHALNTGDFSNLTPRQGQWAKIHRLSAASSKCLLVVAPRDSAFELNEDMAKKYKDEFVRDRMKGLVEADSMQVQYYDQIPVQNQIYDILTYAHRSHLGADQMLIEVVRLNFTLISYPMAELYVRMCPLCKIRSQRQHSPSP